MANNVDIILRGKNEASTAIKQVKADLGGLDSTAKSLAGGLSGIGSMIGVAGLAAAAIGVARLGAELGDLGERVVRSEKYFDAFSGSAAAATENLAAMRRATDGALSTQEMMTSAASLMSMGLARNAGELENVSRMAVILGGNTRTASEAISEFSLLLANQSIPRLDTFGISGAKVRARIEELMSANAGLSREQAFMNAVMEEGSVKMAALEAAGVQAGTSQDRLRAKTADLKAELAKLVEQPYTITMDFVIGSIDKVKAAVGPEGDYGRAFDEYKRATDEVARAQEFLNSEYAKINTTERLRYESLLRNAQAARDAARADYELATILYQVEQGTYSAADAERDYIAAMEQQYAAQIAASSGLTAAQVEAELATNGVGAALDKLRGKDEGLKAASVAAAILAGRMTEAEVAVLGLAEAYAILEGRAASARASEHLGLSEMRMGYTLSSVPEPVPVKGSKAWNEEQESQRHIDELRRNLAEMSNTDIAKDYQRKMEAAINALEADVKSKLGGAMQASINLADMTGGDIFAPGANGPFEAIFRAQAVAVGGIENADEQRWAEMYGLTPETAAKIVADFQKGLFTADVQKLIDVDALVGQIQGEQAAAESTQAFANMIAGRLGVKDAGALVASQTFMAIAGGVEQDDTQQANAAKSVLEAYASNVQAVVKSDEYSGRMIGFGTSTWVYYEQGLLKGAQGSSVFEQAVGAAVAAWLISRGYGSSVVNEGRAGGSRP